MGTIARPRGELTRCSGTWTEAQYRNFVKNQLRSATRKWKPIQDCKKNAKVGYGEYKCECCGEVVPPTIFDVDKGKRVTNIFVDHIDPVVDPAIGWVSWDSVVEGLFCEADNLQLLCGRCHKIKSQEEIDIAKARRAKEKNDA
jgi:hypothetical protein